MKRYKIIYVGYPEWRSNWQETIIHAESALDAQAIFSYQHPQLTIISTKRA